MAEKLISTVKFRPIYVEPLSTTENVSAIIIIDNVVYDIPQSGKTICLKNPVTADIFDDAFVKLYAYDRQPLNKQKNDIINLHEPEKIPKIAHLYQDPSPGSGFWISMPRYYYIYDGIVDLIIVQSYPVVIFTLADSLRFYNFIVSYQQPYQPYQSYQYPPHWYRMIRIRPLLLEWFDDYNKVLCSTNSDSATDTDIDSDDSVIIVVKY